MSAATTGRMRDRTLRSEVLPEHVGFVCGAPEGKQVVAARDVQAPFPGPLPRIFVDLKHLVIGHLTDIKPGSEPLGQTAKTIAKRGAFIGFDTVGHEMRASRNPETGKVQLVLEMINAGYEDNILLSADFSYAPQLKANWGNGFSTVVLQFIPKLKYAGVKDATLHKILVDNPRRFLAFVPKEG